MRKGIFITLVALIVAAVFTYKLKSPQKNYYTPRPVEWEANESYRGAEAWLMRRMANQNTGKIDPQQLIDVRQDVEARASLHKTSTLGLGWGNVGPDNIGGRTRAILVDQSNSNIIYAGSVSGGLFKSMNGGLSWSPVNDQLQNLAVVSLAQASNGDIYAGTGEGMYYQTSGSATGGILGGGIFKSTDGGSTFTQLSSTTPTASNGGAEWAAVGKLAVDPNNPSTVYAATNKGLRMSTDGGASWSNPISSTIEAKDMTISKSGKVWVKIGSSVLKSDGSSNFSEVTTAGNVSTNPTILPRTSYRMRIAISPEDENYVYATSVNGNGNFDKAFQSKDGGATWRVIGENSTYLNPHGGQGDYDHALAVSPKNKERIWVGGVTFFEWSEENGWLQAATNGNASIFNNLYVHSDNHEISFDPKNPNKVYVGNDGGVFRSTDDGQTWQTFSRNYVSTQFYSIGVGLNGEIMGGTQDNGTIFIDPNGSIGTRGIRTTGVAFSGVTLDGDGGYAEFSRLDPDIMFKEAQYGLMGRSSDGGESYSSIYDPKMVDQRTPFSSGYSDFVTPFILWENMYDPYSTDSIKIAANKLNISVGYGTGASAYLGQMQKPYPAAEFIIDSVKVFITNGGEVLTATNTPYNGHADTLQLVSSITNSQAGWFRPENGSFRAIFNAPTFKEIKASASIRYPAGSTIRYASKTGDLTYTVKSLSHAIEPGESMSFVDSAQSMFFFGITSFSSSSSAPDRNERGGIWMTRKVLQDKFVTPKWYHVAKLGSGQTPSCMAVSKDGDMFLVGTNEGRVYRLKNLNVARDSASTSVDDVYTASGIKIADATSVIEQDVVFTSGGRTVTSVSINPNNSDQLIITYGNYGNQEYVYYTDQGNSTSLNTAAWSNVTGNLPKFPVYASTFNFNDNSNKQVLVGTDYGVWATEDITSNSVTWVQENNGLANVPVFDLLQPLTIRKDLRSDSYLEGEIYAGTHGRGVFKTGSLAKPIGIKEQTPETGMTVNNMLKLYPNPASEKVSIQLNLENPTDVMVAVRDMGGRRVAVFNFKNQQQGTTELPLNVTRLKAGAYIVTASYGNETRTGKLVIRK